MKIKTLFVFICLLVALNGICNHTDLPDQIVFSDIIEQINYNLQSHFYDRNPISISSQNILPVISITNQYSSVNYSYNSGDMPISGLIFPELITSRVDAINNQVQLKWWNQTTQELLSQYSFPIKTSQSYCSFAVKTIDYGIFKNFPFYQIIGICENYTHSASYLIKKYRALDTYEVISGDLIKESKRNKSDLLTTYIYDGSSYSTIVSRQILGSSLQYQIFTTSSPNPVTITESTIQQQIGMNINPIKVLFGFGETGNTKAYLGRDGNIVFHDGKNKLVLQLPQSAGVPLIFYKLCWSSTIVIRTNNQLNFFTFINFTKIVDHGKVVVPAQFNILSGIGNKIVAYYENQTYFYSIKNDKIYTHHQYLNFRSENLTQNGFQEDLCTSNAYYSAHFRKQIVPSRIRINATESVKFSWAECDHTTYFKIISKNIEQLSITPIKYDFGKIYLQSNILSGLNLIYNYIDESGVYPIDFWEKQQIPNLQVGKCWIDLSPNSFLIVGQAYISTNTVGFYLCQWGKTCKVIYQKQGQSFKGECFLNVENVKDNQIIHTIFKSDQYSIYIQFTTKDKLTLTLSHQVTLNDSLVAPQFLYANYNNDNFEISYIAQTLVQNNAFNHYYIRFNGGYTATFNYVYQFELNSYQYCSIPSSNSILMYKIQSKSVLVKKIGVRKQKYFALQALQQLTISNVSAVWCQSDGITIVSSNNTIFYDSQLNLKAKWRIPNSWRTLSLGLSAKYLIVQNMEDKFQIYDKDSGILVSTQDLIDIQISFGIAFCSKSQSICMRYNDIAEIPVDQSKFTGLFKIEAKNQSYSKLKEYNIHRRQRKPLFAISQE